MKKNQLTEDQCSLIGEKKLKEINQDNMVVLPVESLTNKALNDLHNFVFGVGERKALIAKQRLANAGVTLALIERITPSHPLAKLYTDPFTGKLEDNVTAIVREKPEVDRYYI